MGRKNGFSLVEVMIYIAIFAVSAVFLVSILMVVTRVQLRQASSHEVEQQIAFAGDTVRRLAQKSSLIDITAGVATTTLRLRMASSSADVTLIYASGTVMYLETRATSESGGAISITPLTDENVKVDSFYVTKYENPGGFAVTQIDLAMSSAATNPLSMVSRTLQTAVTRISAATFDSAVQPTADGTLNLGASGLRWNNAYFSGTLEVGGSVKFTSTTISNMSPGAGIIVKDAVNGNCYKIYTTSSAVTATQVSCP